MRFATFNAEGFPTAFYDDGVHSSIPQGAVQITRDQWVDLMTNPGRRKWQGGAITPYDPPPRPEPMPDPTPLQIIEELEDAPPLSDGTPRLERFMMLMSDVERMKFPSARYIRHDDPRLARFGPALEYDAAGMVAFLRAAAKR